MPFGDGTWNKQIKEARRRSNFCFGRQQAEFHGREMWVQPLPVVLTVKPWSSPHGGSRTTASLVSQNPNIPSASTQQLPILPKPTFNSRTPSSQVPNATAAIFFFLLLCYYSVRTNRQAQRIRSTAELGLLSLLFVLSTDSAAVFSFAVLYILSINAMRRLAASVDKLSNVVSREVPGMLSSLKLSGVEINNLAKQLAALSC
ncbi:uncharacterized protein LOC126596388 isoform X3 [Malus sylvestris]|uniref:uncharacterized protein LOC126596388 isoform X3 n=1 Tax=Malus sylvestris TaxID=3752 RepID=UPI0021ABFE12|nr:uncharacterized protein LOC126596388 isoform X3 [Malus sylvestris]